MALAAFCPPSAWAAGLFTILAVSAWIPGYFPWNNANPTYTYKDQLSKIVGKHNMFIGAT